ncbi:type IV toxin-antitoxin system AbiEi family antitoxin [Alloalcanivorax xenomutans]|uniref:Transcriptional regulator, AbiEi antitoxin, Type IV TA system n=1 Tax=Alloalcanivorax xenomutans TaxID=1094342 RepID=A0A9Q3ZBV8_9GAMM|nr:type IV toxin-antitoxin system AbiEi family antitoxin domain-containing protein [Alloalcanivorax xenomutans]MCE7507660.1 hypothetical protein [Alloalcanivorax xenomutans]
MTRDELQKTLSEWDKRGRYVFSRHEMRRLFPNESEKSLEKSLARMVERGLLQRAARGVYLNPYAGSQDGYAIEHIAKALRPGEYNYVSLESALSEYGVISQIPIDRLTVMTTGRKGTCRTRHGTIEFTHTKRGLDEILQSMVPVPGRPLRIATLAAARRDLRRVGRNCHLMEQEGAGDGQ